MLQARPLIGTPADRQFYNPGRDLAHCGVNIARIAMGFLDKWLKEPPVRKFMQDNGITDAHVYEAVEKFSDAFADILGARSIDAIHNAGFTAQPFAAQVLVLAALGLTMMDATWFAVKDVCVADGTPPLSVNEFTSFVEKLVHERLK